MRAGGWHHELDKAFGLIRLALAKLLFLAGLEPAYAQTPQEHEHHAAAPQ